MSNEIKFSHEYPKLWKQKKARLLYVKVLNAEKVQENKELLEYDTRYFEKSMFENKHEYDVEGYYPLIKKGLLLQLVFLGDKGIPFCTLRPYTEDKYIYYNNQIHKEFDVIIELKTPAQPKPL